MEKLLKSVMFIAFLIAMISCRGNGAKGDTPTPKEEKLTLNLNVEGKNGTLKAFVGSSEKQTGDKIAKGSTVNFKASPEENYEVDKWTGGVQEDVKDRTKASIKADSDVTVTVSFRQKQTESKEEKVTLNFNVEGKNGTLKAFVGSSEKQTGDKIAKGSTVNFKASPEENYEVDKWTGGVQEDVKDRIKASIKADSDVTVTVSFRQKQTEPKEVEIVKVVIDNKEWNSSTKEIIMPKDSTSFAKEKVRVWGRAKTTTDTTEELEVNTISVDPIVPTEEGIELIITTKSSEKLQVGSVRVVVKKLGTKDLGERKDVVLTKITIKGQQANMLSNVVIFNPDNYPKNLKFTKDDVKVEGRAFGDTTSTALEVENIYLLDSSNPAEEIEVKDLGTLFAIKTKSTEKYNACFHGASASLRMDDIILEYIKIGGGKDFKSEVEDGILVITVDKEYKDKEYTKNSLEFKIKDAMSAFIETKEVIPEKMKASNEGFGKKCIARIKVFFTNLEIPFYLRYKE